MLLRLGDPLRLRELRALLLGVGIESSIVEGEVVTRGGVIVRPRAGVAAGAGAAAMADEGEEEEREDAPRSGGFEVEGPATREYAKVRALLESQYVMV